MAVLLSTHTGTTSNSKERDKACPQIHRRGDLLQYTFVFGGKLSSQGNGATGNLDADRAFCVRLICTQSYPKESTVRPDAPVHCPSDYKATLFTRGKGIPAMMSQKLFEADYLAAATQSSSSNNLGINSTEFCLPQGSDEHMVGECIPSLACFSPSRQSALLLS